VVAPVRAAWLGTKLIFSLTTKTERMHVAGHAGRHLPRCDCACIEKRLVDRRGRCFNDDIPWFAQTAARQELVICPSERAQVRIRWVGRGAER
jgi:hypothetical protein